MHRREPTVFINPPPGAFVAIDFETADNYPDSACAVGLVRVENGRVSRRVRQLIRPLRDQAPHLRRLRPEGPAWPTRSERASGRLRDGNGVLGVWCFVSGNGNGRVRRRRFGVWRFTHLCCAAM